MKLDREIGRIETGKRADFAVLENDPTAVAPMELQGRTRLGNGSGWAHLCGLG